MPSTLELCPEESSQTALGRWGPEPGERQARVTTLAPAAPGLTHAESMLWSLVVTDGWGRQRPVAVFRGKGSNLGGVLASF